MLCSWSHWSSLGHFYLQEKCDSSLNWQLFQVAFCFLFTTPPQKSEALLNGIEIQIEASLQPKLFSLSFPSHQIISLCRLLQPPLQSNFSRHISIKSSVFGESSRTANCISLHIFREEKHLSYCSCIYIFSPWRILRDIDYWSSIFWKSWCPSKIKVIQLNDRSGFLFISSFWVFLGTGSAHIDIPLCPYLKNTTSGRNMSDISFGKSLEAVTMEQIDLVFTISASTFPGLLIFRIDRSLSRCQSLWKVSRKRPGMAKKVTFERWGSWAASGPALVKPGPEQAEGTHSYPCTSQINVKYSFIPGAKARDKYRVQQDRWQPC